MLYLNYLVVAGGSAGALLRVILSRYLSNTLFSMLPFPIMLINIIGCLLMGLFVAIEY